MPTRVPDSAAAENNRPLGAQRIKPANGKTEHVPPHRQGQSARTVAQRTHNVCGGCRVALTPDRDALGIVQQALFVMDNHMRFRLGYGHLIQIHRAREDDVAVAVARDDQVSVGPYHAATFQRFLLELLV